MADNSQKGLGSDNMDEQTKQDIQSKGGKASHGGQNQNQSGQSDFQNQNESGDESSSSRGFGAMKEQGRDEEVSEIASLGGQSSSRGGGINED